MHLDLDVSPQVSARLAETARSRGVDLATLVESLVNEHLPPVEAPTDLYAFPPTGHAAARLRARLAAEATDDPETIRQAQASLDEMKRSMNAERVRSGAQEIF